tara:strand:- start:13857 stop:14675 length:819 start_codon:yes stop_codon:yes gene_type:complete
MKVLVLGSSGMIGFAIFKELSKNRNLEVFGMSRNNKKLDLKKPKIYKENIRLLNPDVVINCIGVIKQKKYNLNNLYAINSFFPHELDLLSKKFNFNLIHISTDCVFSGTKGFYNEDDKPDPVDNYGLSKYYGEMLENNNLTLRTSFIGHDNNHKEQLLEWFLLQENFCDGYLNAIYSGLTNVHFAEIINKIINQNCKLIGIYNISSEPISKYDLLIKIAHIYNKDIKVIPLHDPKINRSLDSKKFTKETNIKIESWHKMLLNMKLDYEYFKK